MSVQRLLPLSLPVILAGCSAMVPVHITGSLQQPVAVFGQSADKHERVCLDSLRVVERAGDETIPIWSIQLRGRGCQRLTQVAYGQIPSRFEEIEASKPLKEGVAYTVMGTGKTGPTRVPFRGGGTYVFRDGRWQPDA